MSAIMSDLIEGNITPAVGNATSNAGGKLIKVVELQLKYGTKMPHSNVRILELTTGPEDVLPDAQIDGTDAAK